MNAKKFRVGILGECSVCEGEFKVRDGRVVHHGFTRPGDGQIHGDCFAVGYTPYERATTGCKDYKALCQKRLEVAKFYLASIPSRTFYRDPPPTNYGRFRDGATYAVGVTAQLTFERRAERETRETEYQIRSLESEINRMDKRIEAWTLRDLREVTEEAASAALAAERAARKAEQDAKNAAKAEKAAALQAKRDAKAAEKAAFVAGIVAKLAEAKDDKKVTQEIVFSVKYPTPKVVRTYGQPWSWNWEPHTETLLGLGLATRNESGFVRFDL